MGETITKTIQFIIPEEVIPDSCHLVVMVCKDQSPVYTAEIQQAIKLAFINPNYSATISQMEEYYFGQSSQTAEYTAYIKNTGLLPDTYNISLMFDGPSGWSQSFTTVNGTFNLGESDTLTLNPGDSTEVLIGVNGNSINGFGKTELQFYSEQGSFGNVEFRFTTFGLNILVVDDDGGNDYENYIENELLIFASEYGIITSDFIPANVASINTFDKIIWNTADTEPGIAADEMNALITFLDNGGNLYLNGADIAYQMADPTSPWYSSATQSFFNNYLHSSYVLKEHSATITQGIDGDPITDSIDVLRLTGGTGANTINHTNGKYANQVNANGTNAHSILNFWLKPDEYVAVRSVHNGMSGTGKVVFTAFGFETIANDDTRSLFAEKIIEWLSSPTNVEEDPYSTFPVQFDLLQNYPNPFNPVTSIKFSVPETSPVTIKVFDVLGNEVAILVDEVKTAGSYKVFYDGSETSSGIYFYQMKAGNFISVKKMSVLK
ncbi:MAG: T9SS type A sorting domain-containing protein [Ignavibacteriaceae bacterium]|nr:T9SS type A sorting domain-containing protein [Ignavibacteria bacterium]NNJ53047.1 T9SS type A sorting domain-containing protein [Ignavibacteriaceae bacterium]